MALIGKIVTLFADKEKTLPRFPRTKVSAVSNDNGVGLDVLLEDINTSVDTAQSIADTAQSTADTAKTIADAAMQKASFVLDGTTLTITY